MEPRITTQTASHPIPHRQFAVGDEAGEARRGLRDGEPEQCRRDPRLFVPVLLHLGLLLGVILVYKLEGPAFRGLAILTTASLPIHYLLPLRFKKPAFLAISAVGVVVALGATVAAVVLPVALVIIGGCFLPISWRAKAVLVGAIGLGLAAARVYGSGLPTLEVSCAMLGSLFMYRMILYLYELKHASTPEKPIDALTYFIMLPNFCFPLFPVVDYRTFRRGYFAADVHVLYHEGLSLIARGIVHLLIYRYLKAELTITPESVVGPVSLAVYVVANYALYLHVSGQFHVAAGMLHLFGFRLPETHRAYFLAAGFTDYWRRINIYWKDFMLRVVFNPVAFRFKTRPRWQTLALATTAVFVATWILHAYQSFWLKGTWGFSVVDGLFWGIFGLLVLVNVQLDARKPPNRSRTAATPARPRDFAIRSLKIAATFTAISLLWSLWTSSSLGQWLAMMARGLRITS
jgi:hypothetical protein